MWRLVAALLGAGLSVARADTTAWYQGPAGHRRLVHLSASALGGAIYISSETFLKADLAPSTCRWCTPSGFDLTVRDALRWRDPQLATAASNVDGFVVAPVLGLGLIALASRGVEGGHLERWIDDSLPVIEAAVVAGLMNQAVKFSVGEQRPFVHFGDPTRAHDLDDDVSFYSGHSTLAFAIATSAGVVAHDRGYRLEPVIWAAGYTVAFTTAYLRIAGDQHYFTDVTAGALVGTGVGLMIPHFLHNRTLHEHAFVVTPTPTGAVVTMEF